MKKLLLFCFLATLAFGSTSSFAQDEQTFVTEASAANNFGVGGRAVGMSEAVIVSVKDGTAIVYNPAALTKIKRPEFYLAMSHEKFRNESTGPGGGGSFAENDVTKTRFSSMNLTVPVPTYRGALVVAFGVNRTKSFDRTFTYEIDDFDLYSSGFEEETGGIREYAAAGAIELSSKISAGATLIYYHGGEDYFWNYNQSTVSSAFEYVDNIEDSYSGVGARLGMLVEMSPNVSAAITIDAPTKYRIEENYVLRTIEDGSEESTVGYYEYDLSHPFIFNAGLAFRSRTFLIEGNLGYADWSQMEYDGDVFFDEDNIALQNSYKEAVNVRIGAEAILPQYGLVLRAGFKHDPLPMSDFFPSNQVEKDRNSFSLGLSYLIDRVAMLDIGFARASYEIIDENLSLSQKYTSSKLIASIAYRI